MGSIRLQTGSHFIPAIVLVLASQAVFARGGLWGASKSNPWESSIPGLLQGQHVLLVLDPNWRLCYDTVDVDDFARLGLLPWVAQLRDELTIGLHNPEGDHLVIRHTTAPDEHGGAETYHDLIEAVLRDGNATVQLPSMLLLLYQLSMVRQTVLAQGAGRAHAFTLRTEQLRVTTAESFWRVVELTADQGFLTAPLLAAYSAAQTHELAYPPTKHDAYLPHPTAVGGPELSADSSLAGAPTTLLASITGSVVLLPQIVPALRNHNSKRPLTQRYADPFAWDLPTVRAMLAAFLGAAGATSIPPLEEYTRLPDKRYLQAAYEDYTARDSASRVPPIPTVVVDVPGSPREHALLCYSEKRFVATEAHLDAVMRALFNAALLLEDALPPDGDVRFVQERDAAAGTRAYILKRDLSNAAVHVLTLTLPDWALARGCLLEVNITLDGIPTPTAQPCRQGDSAPWRAAPTMALPEGSTGAVATRAYLRAAAEVVARESCGEAWLLQPKIEDMDKLEYRVYLLGGADATGSPNDTVVYYVAGDVQSESLGARRGLGAVAFLTLLPGHFWSDSLFPPGYDSWEDLEQAGLAPADAGEGGTDLEHGAPQQETCTVEAPEHAECSRSAAADTAAAPANGSTDSSQSRDRLRMLWPQQDLYDNIVQAALDNVRAVAASDLARSSARSVFARADVVLAWHSSGEDTHLVPLINEVSLLNSASKLIDLWRGPREDAHWPPALKDEHAGRAALSTEAQVHSGWGHTLAVALAKEATRSFLEDLHCAEAGERDARSICHAVVVTAS